MWRVRTMLQHQAGFSLETHAASAGLALGCVYSSSDEYEAAVITARRDSGAYRSWHPQRDVAMAAALTAAALLLVIVT